MKTNTQKIHKVADYVVHVVLVLLAFLLLSGLLLSSCAKLAVETEQPISMSVKMPGTKAVVSNMADFQTQGNFGVFGYKTMENVVTDDEFYDDFFEEQANLLIIYEKNNQFNTDNIYSWSVICGR